MNLALVDNVSSKWLSHETYEPKFSFSNRQSELSEQPTTSIKVHIVATRAEKTYVFLSSSTVSDESPTWEWSIGGRCARSAFQENEFPSRAYLGIVERKIFGVKDCVHKKNIVRKLEGIEDLSSYLLKIYELERVQQHRAASKVIFQYIESHFATSNLIAVNALLETINLDKLSAWSISGLVRFTGRAKQHLPSWSSTFVQSKRVLEKKGLDVNGLLAGIHD